MSNSDYNEPIEAEVIKAEECSEEAAKETPAQETEVEKTVEKPDGRRKVNALAIVAICLHWLPVAGLIISIAAVSDAKKDKYKKDLRTLAIVALALSIACTVLILACIIISLFLLVAVGIPALLKIAALIIALLVALGFTVGGFPEITIGIDKI